MSTTHLSGTDLASLLHRKVFAHVHNRAVEGAVVKITRTRDDGLAVTRPNGERAEFDTYEDAAFHASRTLGLRLPRERRLTDLQFEALGIAHAGGNPRAHWVPLHRQAGWDAVVRSLRTAGLLGRCAKTDMPVISERGRAAFARETALRSRMA